MKPYSTSLGLASDEILVTFDRKQKMLPFWVSIELLQKFHSVPCKNLINYTLVKFDEIRSTNKNFTAPGVIRLFG